MLKASTYRIGFDIAKGVFQVHGVKNEAGEAVAIIAEHPASLTAPVRKGDAAGTLKITLGSGEVREAKLVAAEDVEKLGFFGRIPRKLGSLFGGE